MSSLAIALPLGPSDSAKQSLTSKAANVIVSTCETAERWAESVDRSSTEEEFTTEAVQLKNGEFNLLSHPFVQDDRANRKKMNI